MENGRCRWDVVEMQDGMERSERWGIEEGK
jgi:hypothetical protein